MLPFLKPQRQAGVITEVRNADGGPKEPESDDSGLRSCSADLIRAVHAKDEAAVASALKAAFEILESQPHDEYDESEDQESE